MTSEHKSGIEAIGAFDAPEVPDEPDPLAQEELKDADKAQKARSAGVRADESERRYADRCDDEIRWLRESVSQLQLRIIALEADNRDLQDARVDLARLSSPNLLLKSFVGGCGFALIVATVLITVYPPGSNLTCCGLSAQHAFGGGVALMIMSGLLSMIFGFKA